MAIKLFGKTIKSKAADKFLSTFNPSEAESEKRRVKVFDTTSKAKVGAIIGAVAIPVAVAGTATAAGAVLRTGAKATVGAIGKAISGASTATKVKLGVATVLGAPIIASAVITNPTTVTKAPTQYGEFLKAQVNIGQNIGEFTKDPSWDNLVNIAKENPKTVGAYAAGGAALLGGKYLPGLILASQLPEDSPSAKDIGKAVGSAVNDAIDDTIEDVVGDNKPDKPYAPELPKDKDKGKAPSEIKTNTATPQVPVTTKVSTTALTTRKRRRKRIPQNIRQSQSVRVNILNASGGVEKYIRHRTYGVYYG